ncbi:hypothetical protein RJ640_005294 [Escallonia rubra]|uniref:HhH-GPD domain-containing protein n=1 Tax=Escallonia rubra TaxID=112253 RepID=A0AA88U1D5_9ASTE|nr:hypothetical protein RJ640_005294 [Escallonia rubra]
MRQSRKRKPAELHNHPAAPIKSPTKSSTTAADPYPLYHRPTPEECRTVRDALLAFHGFPQQFAKYREQRLNPPPAKPEPSDGEDVSEPSDQTESVLDGLVSTILSQNTTDVNSRKAFASLKSSFPTWEDVLAAESKGIENAIRCGGLAPTKASCIKNMLSCLLDKRGKLCLEYLRDLSVDEIKSELSHFKGIGPKTVVILSIAVDFDSKRDHSQVACVLMFNLQLDDFPVDTHDRSVDTDASIQVFQIAKSIGWVPAVADTKKTYLHLNLRIPNELKFDLNCLIFTHGKACQKCIKKESKQPKKESVDNSCPLLDYCKNSNLK